MGNWVLLSKAWSINLLQCVYCYKESCDCISQVKGIRDVNEESLSLFTVLDPKIGMELYVYIDTT